MFRGTTSKKNKFNRPEGAGNFDNMDDNNFAKSVNTQQGTVQHTPTANKDIVNKEYVDNNINGFWKDDTTNTGTNKTLIDLSNTIHAEVVHEKCFNNSGSILNKGTVVYASGFNVGQDAVEVDKADADNANAMPAIGIVNEDISNGQTGEFILTGILDGVNTTGSSVGDPIYVSTSPGVYTLTKPTGTSEQVQKIGAVIKVGGGTNGRIYIFGAGRSNDIPNQADREFSMGSNKITNVTDPTADQDAATKKYVDDNDSDTTDHTLLSNIGTNTHAQIDTHISNNTGTNSGDVTLAGTPDYITISGQVITRGTIDISDDTNLVAGTNLTLSGDTLNVDDAFLKNDANDTTAYTITAGYLKVTGDNNTNDSEYVPMVLHGTDATPPTASNFPRGTIYIQYTA